MFVNVNDVFRNINTKREFTVVATAPDTNRIVCEDNVSGTPFSATTDELEHEDIVLISGDVNDMYYKFDDDVIRASEAGY